MKLPRGVSGDRLIPVLEELGYATKGLLPTPVKVPLHQTLKVGTLCAILSEVAQMRSVSIESIAELL